MKKKNSTSEFTSQRNAVLVDHFRKQLALRSQICLDKAFKNAVVQEVPRFWVSEQRAAVVISRMLKGETDLSGMYEEKRAMYEEIFRRVSELKELNPQSPVCDLVYEVVNQSAPRSFISWQRAKNIIYAERKRRRMERRLK